MRETLVYDDVLIVPKYSDISSREDIDVASNYFGQSRIPIISAPMDTVSGPQMVTSLYKSGAYGILHRFGKGTQLRANVRKAHELDPWAEFGISIGVKDFDITKVWLNSLNPNGIHSICIDVAHGHHKLVLDTIRNVKAWARENGTEPWIIAGNVATPAGFTALAFAGVHAVRVGIGPGSACTTRETTGVGIPQFSAILDIAAHKKKYSLTPKIIADGGINYPGDIAKALGAGADAVMLGKLLAGADEAASSIVPTPDPIDSMLPHNRYYTGQSINGSNGKRGAPEGIAGVVPSSGPVSTTIETLMHYLRSSMSYVGALTLEEFRDKIEFVQVSPATWRESHTRLGV